MWVSRLSLREFRSYSALDLELSPGVTTFVAPNGWGKTNLVEAVGYVSTLGSHRVSADLPLVRHGHEQAIVSALAHRGGRKVNVELTIKAKGANRGRINKSPARPRDIAGLVPTVVFAPEDLSLVKGDPADRRRFLDHLLVSRSPRYAGVLADLDRALKQRNALLKSLKNSVGPTSGLESTLDIWDRAFAEAAAQVVAGRRAVLADLDAPLEEAFAYVAADARTSRRVVGVHYSSRIDYSGVTGLEDLTEIVVRALAQRRRVEIDRGLTLVGPQRDDMVLTIGDVPAKGYASHGESWSFALALQLAAWEMLKRGSVDPSDQPVLVLDDVFAELDTGRRNRLAARVAEAEQVLITAAVGSEVPAVLSGSIVDLTRIYDVEAGRAVESAGVPPREGESVEAEPRVDDSPAVHRRAGTEES